MIDEERERRTRRDGTRREFGTSSFRAVYVAGLVIGFANAFGSGLFGISRDAFASFMLILRTASQLTQARTDAVAATIQHDGQIKKSLSIPSHKNIPLAPSGKSVIKSARLTRQEGRAHVTNARWDAVDAECARRTRRKRTAKSCGPDAAVLASSRAEVSARRQWQKSRSLGRARSKP